MIRLLRCIFRKRLGIDIYHAEKMRRYYASFSPEDK